MKRNKIDIISFEKNSLDVGLIRDILKKLIEKKNIKEKIVMNVIIVNDETIKEFNRIFRKKDKVTTILSFPLATKSEFITPDDYKFLGDMVINIGKIKREGKDFRGDLKINIIHAFLHLLSYNHDKRYNLIKMEREENRLIGELDDI